MTIYFRLALAFLALSISGCGTFGDGICGPLDGHKYYRGVRMDLSAVQEGGPLMLMAADVPFSAIADTVMVPFIAYEESKKPRPSSREMPTEQGSDLENSQATEAIYFP